MPEQIFDFVTLRQPDVLKGKSSALRYMKDMRKSADKTFPNNIEWAYSLKAKLDLARDYLAYPPYFSHADYYHYGFEELADTMMKLIRGGELNTDGTMGPGEDFTNIITTLEGKFTLLADKSFFTATAIDADIVSQYFVHYGTIWDTLYAKTIMGVVQHSDTNHLINALRVLHVLSILRIENMKTVKPATWPYVDFLSYNAVVSPELLVTKFLL